MAQTSTTPQYSPAQNWYIRLSPGLHPFTLTTSLRITSALWLGAVQQREDYGFSLSLHYSDYFHPESDDSATEYSNAHDQEGSPQLRKEALGMFLASGPTETQVDWMLEGGQSYILELVGSEDHSFKDLLESSSTVFPDLDKNQNAILIEDVLLGKGEAVENGDKVSVWYSSKLMDTNIIYDEANASHSEPALLDIGSGKDIEGWEEGMIGMRSGGRRILTIPASKAYGPEGLDSLVPPNATVQIVIGGGYGKLIPHILKSQI
ncbi:hypothetical protein HYPSUDRAFT_53992 [Hypholoma sublateritium FD-334 SS-4]|uniref:peptidylprolyl isomerase n=1 Tax=Hypholoma sublateritium (strain FD-334 SS-4) TaxID=945553 RepID=A0A0D2NZN5_HYPSF|nr:hypothetical protein HYPSUDRAFT_53992 [Hypholoma sublateritium FD-334 SS-4]